MWLVCVHVCVYICVCCVCEGGQITVYKFKAKCITIMIDYACESSVCVHKHMHLPTVVLTVRVGKCNNAHF